MTFDTLDVVGFVGVIIFNLDSLTIFVVLEGGFRVIVILVHWDTTLDILTSVDFTLQTDKSVTRITSFALPLVRIRNGV